ncbi:MAG: PPC domain-containing protein, partial [Planctomycetota bacterium]
MKRRNLGIKSRVRKYLNVEHLEKRQLLAADCVPCPEEMALSTLVSEVIPERTQQALTEAREWPGQDGASEWTLDDIPEQDGSLNEIPEVVGKSSQDADSVTTALNFNATSDAGSTRSTARDLGIIRAEESLKGSLSYFDRLDVFRFEISADSNVSLAIGNLWGNVDLILANVDGSGIATSRNAGTAAESIQTELKAGVYYIAAQARSFWGTNYQLQVSANPISPPADTET